MAAIVNLLTYSKRETILVIRKSELKEATKYGTVSFIHDGSIPSYLRLWPRTSKIGLMENQTVE